MAFAPITMNLQEELTDQLEIATWKDFTIGGVHITIDECTVVSWIIMIVMTIIAIKIHSVFDERSNFYRRFKHYRAFRYEAADKKYAGRCCVGSNDNCTC